MVRLLFKVIKYIFLRYVLSLLVMHIIDKEFRMASWSDILNGGNYEDWFLFLWMYGLPVLIEVLIIGLPMVYGLKLINPYNTLLIYLLFIGLFFEVIHFTN